MRMNVGGLALALATLVSCGSDDSAPAGASIGDASVQDAGDSGGATSDAGAGAGDGSIDAARPADGGAPHGDPTGPYVVSARAFMDALGVVHSPGRSDEAAKLNEVGVRRIRAALVSNGTSRLADWQALQATMRSQGYARPTLHFDDLIVAYMNDLASTWDVQKPAILEAARAGVLSSIEGPNEINNVNVGNGSHGVNDTVDKTLAWGGANGNLLDWARAIHDWKAGLTGNDATAMANVRVLSPTIASGDPADYAMFPDVRALTDLATLHYYSDRGRQPNLGEYADNPGVGYFANIYRWCQSAASPMRPMVVSECGATTPPSKLYGLRGQAAYVLNQLHDAAGIGAKQIFLFELFDANTGTSVNDDNYGLYRSDGSPKPIVGALSALKNLLSLKNDYRDPANDADTAPFHAGFDRSQLTVTGITSSSRVTDVVALPKSDGSTVLSITNEPPVSDGMGSDVTPPTETATVSFGSTQSWHLYDLLGAAPLTEVASGKGTSVTVPLGGYPKYLVLDPPPGYAP